MQRVSTEGLSAERILLYLSANVDAMVRLCCDDEPGVWYSFDVPRELQIERCGAVYYLYGAPRRFEDLVSASLQALLRNIEAYQSCDENTLLGHRREVLRRAFAVRVAEQDYGPLQDALLFLSGSLAVGLFQDANGDDSVLEFPEIV